MKKKHIIFWLIFLLLIITLPFFIVARPGGGHSYSGGYGDGGGGGGGDLFSVVIWLLFELLPPYISIPLIIVLFISYKIYLKKQQKDTPVDISSPTAENIIETVKQRNKIIEQIKAIDPNFSRVVFLDFVHLLYTKYYALWSDQKQRKTLIPFFKDKTVLYKQVAPNTKISEIVIGSMQIVEATITETKLILTVQINANYTLTVHDKHTRYIIKEKWSFSRDKSIISPEPEKMQVLSCPICGAPADFNDAGYCNSCGNMITPGKHQWTVEKITTLDIQPIETRVFLTYYTAERGTELPTIFDQHLKENLDEFAQIHNIDPDKYWLNFQHNIVKKYFLEIYKNWSQNTWNKVRHLVSDRLWEAYKFWIDAYIFNGLQNKLDDIFIEKIELVKIELDKYYETFTVRIFAQAKDYIIDKQGNIVAGNNKKPRRFSEYWTFIRRAGVEKDDYDIYTCPNCGAPADKIGQSGICEYCGAKITTGNFSWVLAIITQDEEYLG